VELFDWINAKIFVSPKGVDLVEWNYTPMACLLLLSVRDLKTTFRACYSPQQIQVLKNFS